MRKNERQKTAIKVGNISQVVNNQLKRTYTPYTVNEEGKGFYVVGEVLIPEEEFNRLHPVQLLPLQNKGTNSDRTKNGLHGGKSY